MPAYIIETGRSYENPVDSDDYYRTWNSSDHPSLGGGYQITFQDAGPGSYNFGRDEVFYIGAPTETCVANCNSARRGVWRYYSGANEDHLYWVDESIPKNDTFDRRSYNNEPRNKRRYFQLLKESVGSAVGVYLHFSSGNKNSYLSSSSSGAVRFLGYAYSSQSAANSAGVTNPGESAIPLYHYRKNNSNGYDDFYTINPATEVNLQIGVPGVPDPAEALNQEYQYIGIYAWVFDGSAPQAKKRFESTGKAFNTGEVDRSGWYNYNTTWSRRRYEDEPTDTPAEQGWGEPTSVSLASSDANFEWFYGKNGAVKACMPRFLGFHDAFEGQFLYYLYDTSFPFNGPIYGINFTTTDAPCCPARSETPCVPNVEYHSYYYEMREDAWVTQKTRITVDVPGKGAAESFWAVGTDDPMIFFRYTSSSGAFRIGETLNGWEIQRVRYFGDELKCGYMTLKGITTQFGNAFTYNQSITSNDGATGVVLAGYGIKDKAAFFGIYEFPKQLSYYKVELDNKALIPKRTLDEAVLEAIVNNKGEIDHINIVNAGRDYRNPTLTVSLPDVIREEGFSDAAENIPEAFEDDVSGEIALSFESSDEFENSDYSSRKIARNVSKQRYVTQDDFTGTLRQAKAYAVVNEVGCIKQVVITDKGAGYQPGEKVEVYVVERETETREDTFVGPGAADIKTQVDASVGSGEIGDSRVRSAFAEMQEIAGPALDTLKEPVLSNYTVGYIRNTDVNNYEKTKFCDDVIPSVCLDLDIGSQWADVNTYTDVSSLWGEVTNANPNWNQNNEFFADIQTNSSKNQQIINRKMNSGLPGIFGGPCIETNQANLYTVKRFVDLPCPYVAYDPDGVEKVFGYLPFKYCGNDQEFATVRVTLSVEGDVSGAGSAVNERFMDWLSWLPKPTLTPARQVGGGVKCHPCVRGAYKGKCYETANGEYTFVPRSGDENTFDYNGPGATLSTSNEELGQLSTWIGDNVNVYTGMFFNQTIVDANDNPLYTNNVPYTQLTLDPCTNGKFPNDCWHNFVTDGVLDVYSGYDGNGDGIASDDICSGYPFRSCGGSLTSGDPEDPINNPPVYAAGSWALRNVIHSTVAFDTEKRAENNPYIELGPFSGDMQWVNWKTGAVRLLDKAYEQYGNPFFEECDLE